VRCYHAVPGYPTQKWTGMNKVNTILKLYYPLSKIAEKAVCGSIFDNITLHFECRINKKRTPSHCFLKGDII